MMRLLLAYWHSGLFPTAVTLLILYPASIFPVLVALYVVGLVGLSLGSRVAEKVASRHSILSPSLAVASWKAQRRQSRQLALGMIAIPLALLALVMFVAPNQDWVLWHNGGQVMAILAICLRILDDLRGTKQVLALFREDAA